MKNFFHKTAIIDKKTELGKDITIGPYSIIGANVQIKNHVKIHSQVNIQGDTIIDEGTEIFPFASIGTIPQDLKYHGEKTKLIIGKKNTIREHVTISPGTKGGGSITKIGNNCLFMVGLHIAHDCIISDNVILANNATLAGHVIINNNAIIGGLSAVHQYVRIGKYAMIGGMSGVEQDIIPYGLYTGIRSNLRGLNIIGLKRKGVNKDKILKLKKFYSLIFDNKNSIDLNVKNLKNNLIKIDELNDIISFILSNSSRGICTP